MELALHERPALREVLGILVACAIVLTLLAKLDNQAAREYGHRAQKAIAAQEAAAAREAAERRARGEAPAPTKTVAKVEARTESLGGRGPIAIPIGTGWSAGTSAAVARTKPEEPAAVKPPASGPLRRIVGPDRSRPVSERVTAPAAVAKPLATPAPPQPVAASPARTHRSAIFGFLTGVGLLMAAAGAVLLSRR